MSRELEIKKVVEKNKQKILNFLSNLFETNIDIGEVKVIIDDPSRYFPKDSLYLGGEDIGIFDDETGIIIINPRKVRNEDEALGCLISELSHHFHHKVSPHVILSKFPDYLPTFIDSSHLTLSYSSIKNFILPIAKAESVDYYCRNKFSMLYGMSPFKDYAKWYEVVYIDIENIMKLIEIFGSYKRVKKTGFYQMEQTSRIFGTVFQPIQSLLIDIGIYGSSFFGEKLLKNDEKVFREFVRKNVFKITQEDKEIYEQMLSSLNAYLLKIPFQILPTRFP
jgi:hypothetical protein